MCVRFSSENGRMKNRHTDRPCVHLLLGASIQPITPILAENILDGVAFENILSRHFKGQVGKLCYKYPALLISGSIFQNLLCSTFIKTGGKENKNVAH